MTIEASQLQYSILYFNNLTMHLYVLLIGCAKLKWSKWQLKSMTFLAINQIFIHIYTFGIYNHFITIVLD